MEKSSIEKEQEDIEMVIKEEPTLEIDDDDYDSKSEHFSESESSYDPLQETNIKYECTKCDEFFRTLEDVKEHSKNVHREFSEGNFIKNNDRPVIGRCNICKYSSATSHHLLRHINIKHKGLEIDVEWNCQVCSEVFKTLNEETEHSEIKHPESFKERVTTNIGRCKQCNYLTSTRAQLLVHCNKNHPSLENDTEWKCKDCPEIFKTFEQVKAHSNVKHKPLLKIDKKDVFGRCKQCKYISNRNDDLVSHFEEKHPWLHLDLEYKCQECEEFFNTREEVKQHSIEHSEKVVKSLITFEVNENFEVHPSHKVEGGILQHMKNLPAKQKDILKREGVVSGVLSRYEKCVIIENFKKFCIEYSITDHRPFLTINQCGMKKSEQIKFVRYLGQGLPMFTLFCIYSNFKSVFSLKRVKKFLIKGYDLPYILKNIKDDIRNSNMDYPRSRKSSLSVLSLPTTQQSDSSSSKSPLPSLVTTNSNTKHPTPRNLGSPAVLPPLVIRNSNIVFTSEYDSIMTDSSTSSNLLPELRTISSSTAIEIESDINYECPKCDEFFKTLEDVRKHSKNFHPDPSESKSSEIKQPEEDIRTYSKSLDQLETISNSKAPKESPPGEVRLNSKFSNNRASLPKSILHIRKLLHKRKTMGKLRKSDLIPKFLTTKILKRPVTQPKAATQVQFNVVHENIEPIKNSSNVEHCENQVDVNNIGSPNVTIFQIIEIEKECDS
ncbi:hypothetical protein ACFFRR_003469 [Megaselia abdita]